MFFSSSTMSTLALVIAREHTRLPRLGPRVRVWHHGAMRVLGEEVASEEALERRVLEQLQGRDRWCGRDDSTPADGVVHAIRSSRSPDRFVDARGEP